ncbi:kinase domain-containing [Trichoderma arundinaceum]|uniref:Kinase domain-containing n=1 Tax=Trichoderma arundinaceum TaxID=490622 RepID=A0A395NG88_TRIAR|nr:kinase domain-containing [Trichoderma arundinaceum]
MEDSRVLMPPNVLPSDAFEFAGQKKANNRNHNNYYDGIGGIRSPIRPTGGEDRAVTAIAAMPAYLDVHPMSDYEPVGRTGAAWVGSHRQYSKRQLVIVQQVRQATTADFKRFARLAHLHIARPMALYSTGADMHVAYEYIELELCDLLPLFEVEVAAIMSQILDAIHYLVQNEVGFRISTIRVSSKGHVKMGRYLGK